MRDFSKISPAVWQSQRFNNLPSEDGRYLHLYLLTCEHQNSAGCYRLPDSYACGDLRWQQDRYGRARKQLVEAGLIHFDEENCVVLVCRWFKHNPPMNEKHLIGIERVLERLPSLPMREVAMTALNEAVELIEAEKLAKVQRKQKPDQVTFNNWHGAQKEKAESPFLRNKRLAYRIDTVSIQYLYTETRPRR